MKQRLALILACCATGAIISSCNESVEWNQPAPTNCTAGEKMCSNNTVMVCNDQGSFIVDHACDGATPVCNAKTHECEAAPVSNCTEGNYQCSGNVLQVCAGGDWTTSKTCSGSTPKCDAAQKDCVSDVVDPCLNFVATCSDGVLTTCDATNGEGTKNCESDEVCGVDTDGKAACVPAACENFVASCTDEVTLTTCDENGQGTKDCSLEGKVCDDEDDVAKCMTPASNDTCELNGVEYDDRDTVCEGTQIRTCDGESGQFSAAENCATGKYCDSTKNECVDFKTCTVGTASVAHDATACDGTKIVKCSNGEVSDVKDCNTDSQICVINGSAAECQTASSDDCEKDGQTYTAGTKICNEGNTKVLICQSGDFADSEDCATASKVCKPDTEGAICEAPVVKKEYRTIKAIKEDFEVIAAAEDGLEADIAVSGVITGINKKTNIFFQDSVAGTYVYNGSGKPTDLSTFSVGDKIELTAEKVTIYNGQVEIVGATVTASGSEDVTPAEVTISSILETSGKGVNAKNSMLVTVKNVKVSSYEFTYTQSDQEKKKTIYELTDSTGSTTLSTYLFADASKTSPDFIYDVTGVVNYNMNAGQSYTEREANSVAPRSKADIVAVGCVDTNAEFVAATETEDAKCVVDFCNGKANGAYCDGDVVTFCSNNKTTYASDCSEDGETCRADAEANSADCYAAPGCGNGVIDEGEECDKAAVAGDFMFPFTCSSYKHVMGMEGDITQCTSDCKLDVSACKCPDGSHLDGNECVADSGDVCDGKADWSSLCVGTKMVMCSDNTIYSEYDCADDGDICKVDELSGSADCYPTETCGNDELDDGEECDGAYLSKDVLPLSCQSYMGVLWMEGSITACTSSCKYDTSACKCPEGSHVEDSVCVDDVPACTDNAIECVSETSYKICVDGEWSEADDVVEGQKCVSNNLVCVKDLFCVDATHYKTCENGNVSASQAVEGYLKCDNDAIVCETEGNSCDGTYVVSCSNATPDLVEDCATSNKQCVNGSCVASDPCDPDVKSDRCNGDVFEVCDVDHWIVSKDCAADGQTCSESAHSCVGSTSDDPTTMSLITSSNLDCDKLGSAYANCSLGDTSPYVLKFDYNGLSWESASNAKNSLNIKTASTHYVKLSKLSGVSKVIITYTMGGSNTNALTFTDDKDGSDTLSVGKTDTDTTYTYEMASGATEVRIDKSAGSNVFVIKKVEVVE